MQSYWIKLWVLRQPVRLGPGETAFAYLGVVKPILGVFIALSVVEIPILDLIVRHVAPWPPARWIALALSIWGLLWMIGLCAALKLHPHLTGPAGLHARSGATTSVFVPWSNVASVRKRYRSMPSARQVQIEADGERTVLHLVAGSQTSIDVRLREPMTFTPARGPATEVHELRCYADDSDGLCAAAVQHVAAAT